MCDVFESATLTEDQKTQLRAYSYAGSDNSLLLRLYRPVLEWWVEHVPLFTSPNLITLLGFVSINSAAVLTLFVSPDMRQPLPRWVYAFNGLAIWAYQWLDNLDGKQARRTRTSSAFGELFDHGVDAYASTSAAICFNAGLQLGLSPIAVLSPFLVYFPFFFATWEQYWLGSMDLGIINGAMEGIFSLVCLMFAGALFGPSLFTGTISGYTVGQLLTCGGFLLCCACVAGNTWAVSAHVKRKQEPLSEPLKQCIPIWLLLFCTVLCVTGAEEELEQSYIALGYIFVNGLIFGHFGTNLTLAHLSRVKFPWFFAILSFPLVLSTSYICILLGVATPHAAAVWISVGLLLVHTVIYKVILINSLLGALGINFLTLTEEQKNRLVIANEV